MTTLERPGLARTDRGVSRPLRAWLTRALRDDDALDELALAWSAHPLPERRQLASLLYRDISDELVDPSRAQVLFAAMLALEDERTLQQDLLTKLHALEPVATAFVYGDDQLGGALVARQQGGTQWECLLVDWADERATRVAYTTVGATSAQDVVAEVVASLGAATPASVGASRTWREVETGHACERLALPLLRFTRGGGALPPEAGRFASVLTRG